MTTAAAILIINLIIVALVTMIAAHSVQRTPVLKMVAIVTGALLAVIMILNYVDTKRGNNHDGHQPKGTRSVAPQ